MEDYEHAGLYADLCLKGYSVLMNYSSLDLSTTDIPFSRYNQEVIFHSQMAALYGQQLFILLIDRLFYDEYDEKDLRKIAFYNEDSGSKLVSYKGSYAGKENSYSCFSGLATDEVYLIRAECFARQGKAVAAMKDLNTLVKTRWLGPYVDLIATDAEDALKKVLDERKKELILRGTRWSDLRRLNRDSRFKVRPTRTVGGKTYILEPNSYQYTFPIPDDIIQMTGMEQNEGWK
ncbi:SusD family protein [compost metagenome]